MQVQILTPDASVFEGEASVVTLPGIDGSFQILDSHAPLVSILDKGIITVRSQAGEQRFNAAGGVVEVNRNKVSILAEGVNS